MKHEIKTLEDVLRAVNEKNLDAFLIDFRAWLCLTLALDVLNLTGVKHLDQATFKWIDDGKNDMKINIEIKSD